MSDHDRADTSRDDRGEELRKELERLREQAADEPAPKGRRGDGSAGATGPGAGGG